MQQRNSSVDRHLPQMQGKPTAVEDLNDPEEPGTWKREVYERILDCE